MARERIFKKPTIRNVAELAGVSVTTVSHVVSGVRAYAPETVSKVNEAIRQLKYTPSYIARGLRQQSTMTVGVVGVDPMRIIDPMRRRFSEELLRGIALEADRHDYSLLNYSEKIRRSSEVTPFLNGLVDGVLMLYQTEDTRPAILAKAGLPVVIHVRPTEGMEMVGAAYVDQQHLVELCLDHLWELGHRRIAHLAGPAQRPFRDNPEEFEVDSIASWRAEAYGEWTQAREAFNPQYLRFTSAWEPADVMSIAHEWQNMPTPPTAVLCANDFIAVRLIEAGRKLGWNVPANVSVVGIDDIPAASDPSYSISTVSVPIEEVGRESVRCLLRMLSGEPGGECRQVLRASNVLSRGSSRAL